MPRTIVFTENAPVPPISYSQAVKAAGLIFVSGTAPINPVTGRLIMGTAATQTAQCLRNIAAILKAASFSLDKIVSANPGRRRRRGRFRRDQRRMDALVPRQSPARQGAKLPARPPGLIVSIAVMAEA